ncbi:MAG: BrnT family toxin [Methylococcales bacterium]
MEISFDPAKNERNMRERGLSLERAAEFDFSTADVDVDCRHDYGETRYVAAGYLANRLHILCFKETTNGVRVISFRKANLREAKKYGKPITLNQ